ncbi:AAA family ATPase [Mesorhizobium caraganae]|uniref:ATP-dependent nuclease n=1 Tax=Mesorhizobium caraganae TaxID=483206 RepID=UPI001939A7A8|nr:AAA family ATPase [Mesorhizobium caraganae]MBM2711049.1 AAA family ATPase [Mesorhizobium caraganae]
MHIGRISIKNFRCIGSLEVDLSPTSVLIGENNAGKSAILDAIKLALGRRWGRSGQTGFSEYDFPFSHDPAGPRPEIQIRLWFSERSAQEWPQPLVDDLSDIIRSDPAANTHSICMQVTCRYQDVTKSVDPVWQFLNEQNEPYAGAGARSQNLSRFFDYVPCFSMAAMRDANVEFSGRSRFWGPLLRSVEIAPEKTAQLEKAFSELNSELLAADPKLTAIKSTLKAISAVVANGAAGDVDVRAVSANLWEILSKAELVVQGKANDPWLPIGRHGHGVQSLASIFLFRAFVENALSTSLQEESEPILTLEEPEAHLHPQACRSLWEAVSALPGQKIITTHSPYFVQNVPFKDIILVRRSEEGAGAVTIPRFCAAAVPENADLHAALAKAPAILRWDKPSRSVQCMGAIPEERYRDLLRCYLGADRNQHHASLRQLQAASFEIIEDAELSKLEGWAKRIRGEIFFASKWLLCEGQSEFSILAAIADRLGTPADAHGIALIDYQNNGSPGAFAALARSFKYPWAMICDGDGGGNDHISQLRNHHFSDEDIAQRVTQLPTGLALEAALLGGGLRQFLLAAVHDIDKSVKDEDADILDFIGTDRKEVVAARTSGHIRRGAKPEDIPDLFKKPFQSLGVIK